LIPRIGCGRLAQFSEIGEENHVVSWVLQVARLVKIGTESDVQSTDVIEINKPEDSGDIANLGLNLSEARPLLAGVQQEIVAAQARSHAVRRPDCRCDGGVCHVKDYRDHAIATLFGQVKVRLPDFGVPRVVTTLHGSEGVVLR
jgi:hypothetical protein